MVNYFRFTRVTSCALLVSPLVNKSITSIIVTFFIIDAHFIPPGDQKLFSMLVFIFLKCTE